MQAVLVFNESLGTKAVAKKENTHVYRVVQKVSHKVCFVIAAASTDQFSKFFHWHTVTLSSKSAIKRSFFPT